MLGILKFADFTSKNDRILHYSIYATYAYQINLITPLMGFTRYCLNDYKLLKEIICLLIKDQKIYNVINKIQKKINELLLV